MLSARIQAIDGKRTFTFLDLRPYRLLQGSTVHSEPAGATRDAMARPSAPPAAPNRRLSTRSWRTIRPQPAPSAARTASSDCRASMRTSKRFATLAQAINITIARVPITTHSTLWTLPTTLSGEGRIFGPIRHERYTFSAKASYVFPPGIEGRTASKSESAAQCPHSPVQSQPQASAARSTEGKKRPALPGCDPAAEEG